MTAIMHGCFDFQVHLTKENSNLCVFVILPRYKIKSVGDQVSGLHKKRNTVCMHAFRRDGGVL